MTRGFSKNKLKEDNVPLNPVFVGPRFNPNSVEHISYTRFLNKLVETNSEISLKNFGGTVCLEIVLI